jgi:hypothetical protein
MQNWRPLPPQQQPQRPSWRDSPVLVELDRRARAWRQAHPDEARQLARAPALGDDEFEVAQNAIQVIAPELDSRDRGAVERWWHAQRLSPSVQRVREGWADMDRSNRGLPEKWR